MAIANRCQTGVKTSRSSYLRPHEEREQAERRDFWRKLTVRCVLADLKHHKPVDPELAEWAKAHAGDKPKW